MKRKTITKPVKLFSDYDIMTLTHRSQQEKTTLL